MKEDISENPKQDEEFSAQWALDLLRGPTIYKDAFYVKYVTELSFMFVGVCAVPLRNFILSRPKLSSFPLAVAVTGVSSLIGIALGRFNNMRAAKRDAMMVDYIKRHPERFPPPRNKTFAELFEPWIPLR